jgi:hypothetical protein
LQPFTYYNRTLFFSPRYSEAQRIRICKTDFTLRSSYYCFFINKALPPKRFCFPAAPVQNFTAGMSEKMLNTEVKSSDSVILWNFPRDTFTGRFSFANIWRSFRIAYAFASANQ